MNQLQYLANGYRHIEFDQVESTNLTALEYSRRDDPGKLWITAREQLGGKGSRGRSWVSKPGNLYSSLLLRLNADSEKLATLSFVACLALYETLVHLVPRQDISLKWPNDILLKGAKVSGILLENHPSKNRLSAVVIGMGVNCNSNPQNTNYAATNIAALGMGVEPDRVFEHLVVEMDKCLEIWDNGNNFVAIREKWLERAKGIGQKILVRMPGGLAEGIFEDIDPNGYLILRTSDGLHRTISVADIFFPPPPMEVNNQS